MATMEPSPEQFAEWLAQAMEGRPAEELKTKPGFAIGEVARLAYAAGAVDADERAQKAADAELEACCEWIRSHAMTDALGQPVNREFRNIEAAHLQNARRPKPPSLKQQAVDAFRRRYPEHCYEVNPELHEDLSIIARALESIPGD